MYGSEITMYGSMDEFFCMEFKLITAMRERFRVSKNRFERYAAEAASPLRSRWLIKPQAGFVSAEHESFFKQNWAANNRFGFVTAWLGIIKTQGYSPAPVWSSFSKTLTGWKGAVPVAHCIQPVAALLGSDRAREGFENWWLSGRGEADILYRIKSVVNELDHQYDWLKTPVEQQLFKNAHPGYFPPAGGIKPGSSHDSTFVE